MTNITLYTHTNNEMVLAGGTTMVRRGKKWGERNVNNQREVGAPLPLRKHTPFPIGH